MPKGRAEHAAQSPSDVPDIANAVADQAQAGLLVLLCGIPGCGKDALGRASVLSFASGAALSQDEHGGDAARTRTAIEALFRAGRSPLFVLRNGADAGDRSPFIDAARRYGYRVGAIWPSELNSDTASHRVGLYLASVAGCYGRLSGRGVGHETLTVTDDMELPAKVCLNFFRSFRAPHAPGEVDTVLTIPFLRPAIDWEDLLDGKMDDSFVTSISSQMKKGKGLPEFVASCLAGDLQKVQAQLLPFSALRRPLLELTEALSQWTAAQMLENSGYPSTPLPPVAAPSKDDTKRLQREVKIRAAVEHLIAPANISSCRASGSTVSKCLWILEGGVRPGWPPSYFCGAPQLKKLNVVEEEVLKAARTSAGASAALQEGADGVRVEVVLAEKSGSFLVSPIEVLPEACLLKLGRPNLNTETT